jgi:uncharacterized protein (DUF433 family)
MPTAIKHRELSPENVGIYSPRRAGALAGISGQRIGQWARRSLISPSVYEGRPANLYSFYDAAEAIVVRWLWRHDFKYQEIRDALDEVRGEYPRWPLLTAPLGIGRQSVDDRGHLVQRKDADVYVDISGRRPEQIVIKPMLLDFARDMLNSGGWLAQELNLQRIEVDPLKLGGQPSLRGRRWAVDHVARLAADEPGRHVLIEDYGLDDAEVDEAVAWADAAAALA